LQGSESGDAFSERIPEVYEEDQTAARNDHSAGLGRRKVGERWLTRQEYSLSSPSLEEAEGQRGQRRGLDKRSKGKK